MPSTNWSSDVLAKIRETDDLHVAPYRDDGKTFGTLTWIWSVVVDGSLYARAYNGRKSRWFAAAIRERAGRITAAGLTLDVAFSEGDHALSPKIDDAYRVKYAGRPYLKDMVGERARAATVRIDPVTQ